jgi:hypothetical protein
MNKVKVQVMISADVDINGDLVHFNDALYFTQEEYKNITEEQLEQMKQERIDTWREAVLNPSPSYEPSIDELIDNQDVLVDNVLNETNNIISKADNDNKRKMKDRIKDKIKKLKDILDLINGG